MTLFWILWSFVALMSLIPLYYFITGILDGSITLRNLSLWIIILLAIIAVLIGTHWLKTNERESLSLILLGVSAVPGLIVMSYLLVTLVTKPKD
jgi:hypothetical protein